jgi:hypothetical protein
VDGPHFAYFILSMAASSNLNLGSFQFFCFSLSCTHAYILCTICTPARGASIVVVCNYLMRNIETWQIWEELP